MHGSFDRRCIATSRAAKNLALCRRRLKCRPPFRFCCGSVSSSRRGLSVLWARSINATSCLFIRPGLFHLPRDLPLLLYLSGSAACALISSLRPHYPCASGNESQEERNYNQDVL